MHDTLSVNYLNRLPQICCGGTLAITCPIPSYFFLLFILISGLLCLFARLLSFLSWLLWLPKEATPTHVPSNSFTLWGVRVLFSSRSGLTDQLHPRLKAGYSHTQAGAQLSASLMRTVVRARLSPTGGKQLHLSVSPESSQLMSLLPSCCVLAINDCSLLGTNRCL